MTPALLSEARVCAAYLIFFGSVRIGLPQTLLTLASGSVWLWLLD